MINKLMTKVLYQRPGAAIHLNNFPEKEEQNDRVSLSS
jgi:hypothetical protein